VAIVLSHGENGLGGIQSVSGGQAHAMVALKVLIQQMVQAQRLP